MSDNTINTPKELSYIFTNATITNPTLPPSSHPDTPELPRVKTWEEVEATRVEEVREETRPAIETERRHLRPSTHMYPQKFKALAIQAIILSELEKTIGTTNHSRVYHLSYMDTQQYINAILNPITGNMMDYRHLIVDPATG